MMTKRKKALTRGKMSRKDWERGGKSCQREEPHNIPRKLAEAGKAMEKEEKRKGDNQKS